MEATLIDEPFTNDDFLYEIKWDGYRCIAYAKDGEINLRSKATFLSIKMIPLL